MFESLSAPTEQARSAARILRTHRCRDNPNPTRRPHESRARQQGVIEHSIHNLRLLRQCTSEPHQGVGGCIGCCCCCCYCCLLLFACFSITTPKGSELFRPIHHFSLQQERWQVKMMHLQNNGTHTPEKLRGASITLVRLADAKSVSLQVISFPTRSCS